MLEASEKYSSSERLLRTYFKMIYRRKITRRELADEFGVTLKTVSRDIDKLGQFIPTLTKQGTSGGISIMPGYNAGQKYLSNKQEQYLIELLNNVDAVGKDIIQSILNDFSMSKHKPESDSE